MENTAIGAWLACLVLAGACTAGCADSANGEGGRHVPSDAANAVAEVTEPVAEQDLPEPVAAAMHSHPRAIFVAGKKISRGGDVRYALTLRGTRKTAMIVTPDGTVVSFE